MEDKTSANEIEEYFNSDTTVEETSGEETTQEKVSGEGETPKETNQKEADNEIKSLRARMEHWRNKYGKLKEEVEKKGIEPEKAVPPTSEDERLEKVEFLLEHKEIPSKSFLDDLSAYARGRSISLEEAYKSDVMQAALKALQEKSRKEEKIPAPSSRFTQKEAEDIANMSREEKKKNYSQLVEKILSKNKGNPRYE